MLHFLLDMFLMTVIALVSVVNQIPIKGLHLFWDLKKIKKVHFNIKKYFKKREFSLAVAVSMPLLGGTWTLIISSKTKIIATQRRCILFWTNPGSSSPRKTTAVRPLTSHLKKTFQVRRDGTCWRSKDKLMRDVHQWTREHEHTSGPAKT